MDTATERVRDVYESDHARLWRSVYGYSRSSHVADEAVAEAFAQVLRRGDAIGDVRAWVWRTAFAIARGELQQSGPRLGHAAVDAVAERDHTPELARLLESLATLSDDDRRLLVLCHIGGWKPQDLAPVLGVSGATLRVRLHRATRRARSILEEDT